MSTIKDVARIAGVSIGTVSRYINGESVKKSNCERIEEAIKQVDFRINQIARGLKTSRSNTIGVVVPDISNPYANTIVKYVEKSLYKLGYNIFTCDTWSNPELEAQKVELLVQRQVDGIIIYPCSRRLAHISSLVHTNIPIVAVDMSVTDLKCDQVLTDNINATYEAVSWLISKNHRRIGIINGTPDYFTSGERFEGYRRVLSDYSIEQDESLVKNTGYSDESGYNSMMELLKLEVLPTAVITCNYDITFGAMSALMDSGVKVPEQISIIGFDDVKAFSLIQPKLSVIAQPLERVGEKAAELIVRRIRGDYEGFPCVNRLKTELIFRNSTKEL